jgi:hypothetical protein
LDKRLLEVFFGLVKKPQTIVPYPVALWVMYEERDDKVEVVGDEVSDA